MFAVAVTLFIVAAAVAVDFSRYVLAGEKLQTATDAAATAAAMSSKRYVRIEIDPGSSQMVCCSEDSCWTCCIDCGDTFVIEGREDELIDRGGYRKYFCSCNDGSVQIIDRWVVYENNGAEALAAAKLFFDINRPKEMDTPSGGDSYISSVRVAGERGDPLYPSVVVRTQGKLKTVMMNFLDKMYPGADVSELGASRCSQGGSFYYDLNGKWHRASAEGCN